MHHNFMSPGHRPVSCESLGSQSLLCSVNSYEGQFISLIHRIAEFLYASSSAAAPTLTVSAAIARAAASATASSFEYPASVSSASTPSPSNQPPQDDEYDTPTLSPPLQKGLEIGLPLALIAIAGLALLLLYRHIKHAKKSRHRHEETIGMVRKREPPGHKRSEQSGSGNASAMSAGSTELDATKKPTMPAGDGDAAFRFSELYGGEMVGGG